MVLSEKRKKLLELILMDPQLLSRVLLKKDLAKHIALLDDGSIELGKTRVSWWNRLLGDYKVIEFDSLILRLSDAISGQGVNKNEAAFQEINKKLIDACISSQRFDDAVDVIFDSIRYGGNSDLASKYITREEVANFDPQLKKVLCRRSIDIGSRTIPITLVGLKFEDQ